MEQVGDRIILEGVLQQFDRLGSNGRIYPETYHAEAYERLIKRLIPDKRMEKINSLRNSWK
jgi:hypothetical protein